MGKRILIVGGVAGGASVAARARRLSEDAEIIMFEKGPNVSFSNCCLPYHLSGIIEEADSLVLMDPEVFKNQYNIQARTNTLVTEINRNEKTITVKDLTTDKVSKESYDKLFLSPGARAIMPRSIEGINSNHVFKVRNVVDIKEIKAFVDDNKLENVVVVGGGYVGVEVAENFKLAGKNVTLVEALNQIMSPLDYDMAQILHKELLDQGMKLVLSDGVQKITEKTIELCSGTVIDADVVIMAIGVAPETGLAQDAGLDIGTTGAIKVNQHYQTNDPDIYAVGDAIEVFHKITGKPCKLALAGPAQRQARAAIDHVFGMHHNNTGVIGSSAVLVFDLNAAGTGLNEKACKEAGLNYDFVYIIPGDKVGLMPESHPMHFKLIYEYPTGKILGAQAIGKGNVDKRVDVIATLITMGGTLEDLKELELCYAPPFGTAKDVVNHAALVALNVLYGKFNQVKVTEVRELVEKDAFIVDVREPDEFAAGHLVNAKNIPLSQFRDRMSEIPKDVPVYLHCRSSQRSYNALMALQNLGYTNVFNISGSYLGISCYEYYNDVANNRTKIVTEYNFN
jgi:NADPH-dependent 2,4-dienoyl-CoA reductase/sulfur reductase-like enzyme/rhodanese-related sulfurtransferase